MALGTSFQPGGENGDGNGNGAGDAPLQTAIRLLSLRLPTFGGARTPLDRSLLTGRGASGLPQGDSMQALRRLLGLGASEGGGMPTNPGGAGGGPGSVVPPLSPPAGRTGPRVGVVDPAAGRGGAMPRQPRA